MRKEAASKKRVKSRVGLGRDVLPRPTSFTSSKTFAPVQLRRQDRANFRGPLPPVNGEINPTCNPLPRNLRESETQDRAMTYELLLYASSCVYFCMDGRTSYQSPLQITYRMSPDTSCWCGSSETNMGQTSALRFRSYPQETPVQMCTQSRSYSPSRLISDLRVWCWSTFAGGPDLGQRSTNSPIQRESSIIQPK